MTLQAPLIVVGRIFPQRLMRVVTGRTTYLPIIRITLTVKDAIRLKANVVDFHALQQRELISAAMTQSAKLLRQFITAQQFRIVDAGGRQFTFSDSRDVLAAWTMTALATDPMRKCVEPHL